MQKSVLCLVNNYVLLSKSTLFKIEIVKRGKNARF